MGRRGVRVGLLIAAGSGCRLTNVMDVRRCVGAVVTDKILLSRTKVAAIFVQPPAPITCQRE